MDQLGKNELLYNNSLCGQLLLNHLAWEFEAVLPGTFERNRPEWRGYPLPILAPVPDAGAATQPRKGKTKVGPFIYALCDNQGDILYIGKSSEKSVTRRWLRPDRHSGRHYWSHGTTGKPDPARPKTVEKMAAHIRQGKGNLRLLFIDHATLFQAVIRHAQGVGQDTGTIRALSVETFNKGMEALLIREFQPPWNTVRPPVAHWAQSCGRYWEAQVNV